MSEDDELQIYLDEISAEFAKKEADRKAMARITIMLTWEPQMFNFKVEQFRRAIGA